MITKEPAVATTASGETVDAYSLTVGTTSMRVLTLGGIITHLFLSDRNGQPGDVVLGFDDPKKYLSNGPYLGALIGRYGNRIRKGKFTLDGVEHQLTTNDGANHLHGGKNGYDKRVWNAETFEVGTARAIRLTLRDLDGSEGYPGTVTATVTYTLHDGVLRIDYEATTNRATPINLTNHTYFNLHDAGASSVAEHVLQLDADQYLPGDAELIPKGPPTPVKGTPIDFTTPKPIGRDVVAMGGNPAGYDHNLLLREKGDGTSLHRAAIVSDAASGRSMECWTNEPGVQFYSGNFLDGTLTGKGGAVYKQRHGFCLETQHYPNSPNEPTYPSTILRPGETYRSTTEYRFSAK